MTYSANGNETAFPSITWSGLTKREAAAIMIAAGLSALGAGTVQEIVVEAVRITDALLAELAKREAGG